MVVGSGEILGGVLATVCVSYQMGPKFSRKMEITLALVLFLKRYYYFNRFFKL